MRPWLSPRGTLAALLVGAAVLAGTGWRGLVLLLLFFVSGSLLTPGGGRREPIQVAANGGVAAAAALLCLAHAAFAPAFAGALAAAAADTWSTEIGGRSGRLPRLITSGARVPAGTSGGVTLLGTLGGAAGAALIGAGAVVLHIGPRGAGLWITLAGVAGGLFDSLLGAAVQARYRCAACGAAGERAVHDCGGTGHLVGGRSWITNDTVNFLATVLGAAVASVPVALQRAPLA